MVAPHWSIKAEYLYADLGRTTRDHIHLRRYSVSTLTSSVRDSYNIARAGVNWRF